MFKQKFIYGEPSKEIFLSNLSFCPSGCKIYFSPSVGLQVNIDSGRVFIMVPTLCSVALVKSGSPARGAWGWLCDMVSVLLVSPGLGFIGCSVLSPCRAELRPCCPCCPSRSHSHFLWLESLIRRDDAVSFCPFNLAPQEPHEALPCPVHIFRSLSRFFCMPMLYTSEVCVTGRWLESFITVIMKSLETVDRESISSVSSPTWRAHFNLPCS